MTAPPPPAAADTSGAANPLLQLTLTRLRLFFREPGAVFWTFGFPLVLSVALGIAFRNRPPEPVRVGSVANEARLDQALRATKDLRLVDLASERDGRLALRTGRVDLLLLRGEFLYDPTRPESRLARAVTRLALEGRGESSTIDKPVVEPGSRYIDFLIPGLIGMTLMSSGMWGIGYVVVEMRTKKLLKRLVATPMSRAQFLFSFVLMRTAFLFLELPILIGFGWIFFDVGVAGSLALLVFTALLGALAFGGIGLLVASRAQNTQTASGLINLVMMPMFIGSGVFFSTAKFPDPVQPFLRALPLTALNDALRAVMIDGASARAIAGPLTVLGAIALVSFAVALRIFRWR